MNVRDSIISLQNVTKIFRKEKILNDLTFDIPKGSITTILGFSGAGKSTLVKHILGLLSPTSGTVRVLGQDVSELSKEQLRDFRRNFGMLFQYAALFDSLTAFENVAFPLKEFENLSGSELEERVESLLHSVDLRPESYHLFPSELSGGMRKRVGLARALALKPQIMLYDEPTTGLDPITTKRVNDLIKKTSDENRTRGMTSVIISHDVKATLEISDYVAFLDRGKIAEYLAKDDFIHSENPAVRQFLEL